MIYWQLLAQSRAESRGQMLGILIASLFLIFVGWVILRMKKKK